MSRAFRHILTAICTCLSLNALAQVGGNSVYEFMNMPASSRITATGGNLITVYDNDLSLAYHNPALLNPSMHNRVVASTNINFAGVKHGYFGYARDYENLATFQAGLQFVSYGKFDGNDERGISTGEFSAGEFLLNVGAGKAINENYSFGGNVKLIYSQLESYTSIGGALDMAAAYSDSSRSFTTTLLIKNIGFQFTPYHDNMREPLPLDIQIGFSKRLKYIPFRISVVYHNLQKWDIRYDDPNIRDEDNIFQTDTSGSDDAGNNRSEAVGNFFDNFARHLVIGGELYIKKVFRLSFGYNHQRRAELRPTVKKGLAGLSFGFGINIKQFSFDFARARYHGRAATNQITVSVDIQQFKNRTRIKEPKPTPVDGSNPK